MASPFGTPTPVTINNNTSGLTFDTPMPSTSAPTAPVGVQAKSPNTNVSRPSNSLPTSQVAPRDLSNIYAKGADGTIYNKNSQTKFSNPNDFYKDAGVSSFNNLKFDTNYTPTGKETVYGQPSTQNFALGDGNKYDINGNPVTATPTPPAGQGLLPSAFAANNTPTTATGAPAVTAPPNNGTTGVSQGSIIAGQVNNASNNPDYVAGKAKYNSLADQIAALQAENAKQTSNIEGSGIDLSLATGREGILNKLFSAKQGALSAEQQAAQQSITNAIAEQGATNTGLSSAASANAPITGVPYGTQTIQPSQPNGSTTSGAANLNSLIGQGTGTNGHPKGEFFNTNTGQGFHNPQELADFVNQQMPGLGATAANVFDLIKNSGSGSANGGNLNPINNVQSIAQQVISGQLSPSAAYAMGGSVANWQTLLNQTLQQLNPGFDQSAAQAKYDANQSVQGGQAQTKAQYQSAAQVAQNLTSQFSDLLKTYNLNPSDINVANGALQEIAKNTSDWRYQALSNYINDIANTYSQILTPPGGSATDMTRSIASSMLNATASGTSLANTIAGLDQQAQAKIAGVSTPSTTNGGSSGGGGGGGVEGQTAAGGSLVYKNGMWVKA